MSNDELNPRQAAAVISILLILLVPIAVALAIWLKRRYAAAVVEFQSLTSSDPLHGRFEDVTNILSGEISGSAPKLTLDLSQAVNFDGGDDATLPASRLRGRVLTAQFVTGMFYWWGLLIVLTVALLIYQEVAGDGEVASDSASVISTHLVLWPLLVLPAALPWALLAGTSESRIWLFGGASMLCFALGLGLSGSGWGDSGMTVVVCAVLTMMMVAFMRPSVRGAGPPLVGALIVTILVLAIEFGVVILLDNSPDDESMTLVDWAIELPILFAMLALAGYIGWRKLLRLARRYASKQFSEMQLAFNAYWGLITLYVLAAVLTFSFDDRAGAAMEWLALVLLILWLVWRPVVKGALKLARRGESDSLGPLLLLRVFKPSERSEAFIDRFLARWRFAGPVWMIAGPDLAGAYMEPDEFFAFLSRQLRQRYIANPQEVTERVSAIDNFRDPDGRFRASELFCANTTWKQVVTELIARAGVILLDLREYNTQRAGTRFELTEILRHAELAKVLILISASDDLDPIRSEILSIWQQVGGARVDEGDSQMLKLISVAGGSDTEMRGLFRAAATASSAASRQA